jgi:hypothetical protein
MIKLNHGLKIRLYFQKTSTVLTVFGLTILTDKAIKNTSKIIAGIISQGIINHITGTNIRTIGITTQSIIKIIN